MGKGVAAAWGAQSVTRGLSLAVKRLRGQVGARQWQGARQANQESGGGLPGIEEAALAGQILSKY